MTNEELELMEKALAAEMKRFDDGAEAIFEEVVNFMKDKEPVEEED